MIIPGTDVEKWPKDKVCIVGVGETEYTSWGQIKRSTFNLCCEAILKAIDDAGLKVTDIDGMSTYANDIDDPMTLCSALGMPHLRFMNMVNGGGGGGGSAAVMNALMAVACGAANYVVCYRSLAQGQTGRYGTFRGAATLGGAAAFSSIYGTMTPAQNYALHARRHMHQYGTLSRHFSNISVACYKHAQRNPRAVAYGHPITVEDAENSRFIADPIRLYHCCRETDGSAAIVVTSAERARDMKHRPVYIMAAAQGTGRNWVASGFNCPADEFPTSNFEGVARDLYARAGITPKDVDVAQVYENFVTYTLMSIENHGFCKRGEGGPFTEGGRLEWPDGELPVNTSGGNTAEAYTHGFELVTEATRQMRGTSTCQVENAEICLVVSGPGVSPVSDMIVRR